MTPEPSNPRHCPETFSEAVLYRFTGPALTPEEAGPRERHGRPAREAGGGRTGSMSVLYGFTDPPGGLPLDSPEVVERERRRREQRANGEGPGQQPSPDAEE
jgi:hypothetical protein